MSNTDSGDKNLSKNQRRDAAREKARELREAQKKKEKRSRLLLQGGIVLGVLVVIAIVALVISSSVKPAGPGPANMASDGIVIGKDLVAARTAALAADAEPIPSAGLGQDGVVDIRVYLDYLCPICGVFEAANGDQIRTWVESGIATVELHPVAILDNASLGTKYSTRAANAAACVANYAPDNFFDYNALLFINQPDEQTEGLSDDQLKTLLSTAGVASAPAVETCIDDKRFSSWVSAATKRAVAVDASGNLLIVPVTKPATTQFGTPTILVNGVRYTGGVDDAAAFATFVLQQAGTVVPDSPTETPAP